MSPWNKFLLILFITSLFAQQSHAKSPYNVVYGSDDRQEICHVSDPVVRRVSRSAVALVDKSFIKVLKGGLFEISGEDFGASQNLCLSERFYEQVSYASCSGVLVKEDVILTAGHCIENQSQCDETKFVFDLVMGPRGQAPKILMGEQVYSCKKLLKSVANDTGMDFALIQLDRRVQRDVPSFATNFSKGDADIFMIGFPSGLAEKYSGPAQIHTEFEYIYSTNLDAFGGNSGSPIYRSSDGALMGILISGEDDWVEENGCFKHKVCDKVSDCEGETVLKIDAVRNNFF